MPIRGEITVTVQLRATFLLIALIAPPLAFPVDAQWRVGDSYNQWGEKNEGKLVASSAYTPSVNGRGQELRLEVVQGNERFPCQSSIGLLDRTPMSLYLMPVEKEGEFNIYNIPMRVGEVEWEAFGAADNEMPFVILIAGSYDDFPVDRYGNYSKSMANARHEQVVKWMAQASTFKMILPTREYGRLIYKFDMTGSRKAIQIACPHLF